MRGTAGLVLLALAAALEPCAAAATATDTIRHFYDVLLGVMQNAASLGPKGRYDRLAPVIGQTFDLPYMTRVAVGSAWASIPAAKQDEVTDAFRRQIAATYADRFDGYSGQKLQVTGEQPRAAGAIVDSRIVKADGSAVVIRYLMRQDAGGWRVADVYLSGTISELATRRSEFSSIVEREGVDGLIATLNRKTDMLVYNQQGRRQ
jgi:phospholipid transport system substrate-binding protein